MFNFMKKSGADEKEKRKKEKKERKDTQKQSRSSMTAEELLRLDEVRRSLKIRVRRKDKEKLPSGITADYSATFFASLNQEMDYASGSSSLPGHTLSKAPSSPSPSGSSWHRAGDNLTQSDSSEASLTSLTNPPQRSLPPLPPRPPARGILKSKPNPPSSENAQDNLDSIVLVRNTLQNEVITYQNVAKINNHGNGFRMSLSRTSPSDSRASDENLHSGGSGDHSNYLTAPLTDCKLTLQSTSPSADSLTDTTTNSSFATPPFSLSPVGESQGFPHINDHFTSGLEDFDLCLPPIILVPLPKPRVLTIQRQPRGDFGFSLRRAMVVERLSSGRQHAKAVIFAEPGQFVQHKNDTGLLPGDRLLEVNGIVVDDKSREEIIDMIKSSNGSVTVKVQPVPELSELTRRSGLDGTDVELDDSNIRGGTLRRSGSRRFKKTGAKSDDQLANERAWLEAERLWLIHRAGFTASRRLHGDDQQMELVNGDVGKITIRLEASDDVLHVEDDDVEKANPPQFDHAEDLAHLRYLNESSALHTLRQRYASNLVHTYAGPALIVVSPPVPLAIYSDKVVSMFRGCKTEDMPPHIYSLAQSAYRGMQASRRDQAIVLMGRSGSGKTTNFKHVLHYLLLAAGTTNRQVTLDKVNAALIVLEAFGNARTALNVNATRFTQIFSLDFDQSGQVASASVQVLLLERSRVARRPDGEGTFHALHQLLAGAEGSLRRALMLDAAPPLGENNAFLAGASAGDAAQEFARTCAALSVLGVTDVEQRAVWSVLAAIYHLGYAGAVRAGTSSRWQFSSPQSAQHAAQLLGTSAEELARAMFGAGGGTPSAPRAPFRTPSPTEVRPGDVSGPEALEGMVTGLYSEAFSAVAALVNRSISAPIHTVSSLVVVDTPGFQNPASVGRQAAAGFEDLCHNYLNERLQMLFHHTALTAPRDRYLQEHIECAVDDCDDPPSPAPMVALLDRAASTPLLLRASQSDLRNAADAAERRGLLWMLDEQAAFPAGAATEEAFVERLFQHYGDRDHQTLLRKAPGHNQFILQHLQGTNPVLYSAQGWLKASRENPISKTVISILQESNKEEMSQLFVTCRGSGVSGGSIVGIEGTQSLRRASSIRRTFTSGAAGIKRKSLCLQVKFTVDGLVETLRRTRLKFVHCFLPQHSAGLVDVRTSTISADDDIVNIPLLRSQLRGSQLLAAVRLHKQGFPKHLPLAEFRRRFRLLAPPDARPPSPVSDERRAAEDMILAMDLDLASYRVGLSQIFFRPGVVATLEAARDERLSERVVGLQARCRGYLARRKLAKLRLQDTAIRCIQRNVRKLLSVQDWPWWRLLAKVTPLLDVHRTEDQLRATQEELESLRAKVEKLDSERSHLQHDNDKLGAKLSEMTADLAEEHSTSVLATERLEAETSERLRLERELQEMQVRQQSLHATSERLEMELLYLRGSGDGATEEDDDEDGGGVYRQRYERTLRELELTKHRLHQQHEDDLEQLVALKKQMEKKLADAYEEVNEQRQVAGQWKRKVQKLTSETNDLRLLLEEQNSRNTLLEKKQRRFDGEFQSLQEQLRLEKQARERASREREIALGEKYTLEQNLSATKLELELKEEHANALSRELDELATGGHSDPEVAALKRAKHELDKKLAEQEEELDDLAGQLSLVSQAKLRIEMSLEQQRKEARREQAQRDEELEDVRGNATKKVKALESQLESEHEERTQLLREKHDLERRLAAAQEEAANGRREGDATAKLRRDLKRTRALLKDANIQLQKQATDVPSKQVVRQLKNQLEDLELARASAVKSRQSAEAELADAMAQLEEAQRVRADTEEKAASAARAAQDLRTQLDENEEELAEVLKKYRGSVAQLSAAQSAAQDAAQAAAQAESERDQLRDQLADLAARLECVEAGGAGGAGAAQAAQRRIELRAKEMESRLELEQTTRARMEVQISRLKDSVEKLQAEATAARAKEQAASGEARKLSRALREAKEAASAASAREADAAQRRKEAETRAEAATAETQAARADLRLALTRINDLQAAIQDECSQSESDRDSESDESIESFLVNNETQATWNESRLSLSVSPAKRSSSAEMDAALPKTIAEATTHESYA